MILSNNFPRRSYGRIFVDKPEDAAKVREIIERMDAFEAQFLPEDLIAVFNPDGLYAEGGIMVELAQTGKFDSIDLNELQLRCWMAGVKIFCWRGGIRSGETERFDLWQEE